MASSLYLVVLVVGLCAPIYCASLPSTPNRGTICPSPTKATPSSQVSSSNTDFAFRLFRRLVLKTPGQNVVFSPARVSAYVEKVTKGKVVDLVRHLDPLTAMVLVNHIFFKAKWEKPFDPAETNKSSSFLVDKSVTVQVPMMHQMEQLAFGLDSELNCSVLQMDYSGNALAFFILPGHGKMRQLEEALSARTLRKWSCSLQKRWVEVFIPKFSISASYDLEAILPEMGIQDAFDNNADFSGITKAQFLKVSKATRKAVLEVGELGSEAAAATETKLELRAKEGPAHTVIRFHEPFVLLIVDKVTQNILFVGKVANPTKS
ncbi:serpin A9 isoform X2 [Choloepus didactylus]|uniref:serpin A9 isoform X2 n=1 Tax=Choloepus didactylus TaxID=27675 RepID=UPI00189F969A|nr:serpin A9 isoform X2 [Choloepus didactylus]